ncbi:MAG: ABC-F family ATP-binding cassette domain-containing protein [Clostridia bacterium]|nr:ABC-F family ATP-binding cassette domain-containing protein [Clostridia bacterium]
MSLIAVHNIRKSYRNKVVLADISLQIEKGERVALIGPNGSGKTTLLKIMMGQVQQDEGEVFCSKKIKVGYLSQYLEDLEIADVTALHVEEIHALENKMKVLETQMATMDYPSDDYEGVLYQYGKLQEAFDVLDGYTIESMIKKTLLGLGLKEAALEIPLNQLSGGEKMRVALARIIITEPDLLILDEPTNHLDIKAIEWLEQFLKRFNGGVLMVSHDRYFLDHVTTRICELHGGHLTTKKCNYTTYLEQKSQLRDYYLKAYNQMKQRIKSEKEMVVKLRKYKKIKQSQSREKALVKYEEEASAMLEQLKSTENLQKSSGPHLYLEPVTHLSHEVVVLKDVTKAFGNQVLFQHLDLVIYGGERVAIIGPNGCGKTTLIHMILGRDQDYHGEVNLGKWVDYVYLGQEVTFEDEMMSMLTYIMKTFDLLEKESKHQLAKFQFYGDVVNTLISELSGGEKVRIKLLEMMLKHPHCLILDEPTNHLDLESRIAIEQAILNYKGTVIAVSHDRYYLNKCVDRIIEIKHDQVSDFLGNYDEYIRSSQMTEKIQDEYSLGLEGKIQALESKMKKHLKAYDMDHRYI